MALGEQIGYPLLIKAAAGGGGKGMKVVRSAGEAVQAFESAQREGQSYFADASVYVERYLEDPRHVEVQVLADAHGNVIHLGERDCTIQRRHQKLVEETPSPAVAPELRERIGQIAVDAARAAGYRSAGTIEGLLAPDGAYYFMEMNTRIQVEHTITEVVAGVDIVRAQVQIAAGERLEFAQDEIRLQGHAIECRINAEDVANGFLPSPGTITVYREPAGPGVRVDSGVTAGSEISPLYDPMIAKLIVRGADREDAIGRMLRALGEFEIGGVKTLIGFHKALLSRIRASGGGDVTASSSRSCFCAARELAGGRRVASRSWPAERSSARPLRRSTGGGWRPGVLRARAAVSGARPPQARACRVGGLAAGATGS